MLLTYCAGLDANGPLVKITAAISSAKSCLALLLPEQAEIGCDDEPTRIAACDASVTIV